jgi:hypothetical protein
MTHLYVLDIFRHNLLFLGFNTSAIGANCRTSTTKKVKDVIQTLRANKLLYCIVDIGKSFVYTYSNAECNKILNPFSNQLIRIVMITAVTTMSILR